MANPPFRNDHFYHVYNRGVEKRTIFLEERDYLRFLETLNFYRLNPQPMKLSDYRRLKEKIKQTKDQTELVKIVCYCLMPNHFHLLIKQVSDNGISTFLRKISDSYTKYFNTKYKRVGSLFQGVFKAKLVVSDEYLLQLSKYIHRNPLPLFEWEARNYPYSSYRFYLSPEENSFCDIELISAYFSKSNPNLSYQSFVEESDVDDPSLYSLLIDSDY